MVPVAEAPTLTVTVNEPDAPGASVPSVQTTVPVPPTIGAVQAAGRLTDWKVVLLGTTTSSLVVLVVVVPPLR